MQNQLITFAIVSVNSDTVKGEALPDKPTKRPGRVELIDVDGFRRRLSAILEGRFNEFSRQSGLSKGSLGGYRDGPSIPKMDALVAIANTARVSLEYLVTGHESPVDHVVLLSYLDVRPSAGPGTVPNGGEAEPIYLPREILVRLGVNPENARVLRASGTSMEPTIGDGDLILIDASKRTAVDGQIFVFSVGDDIFVKRLRNIPGQGWMIISDNPEIAPVPLPKAEPMRIYGRVRWTSGASL